MIYDTKVIPIVFFIIFGIFILILCFQIDWDDTIYHKKPYLQPGQVWVRLPNNNPYEKYKPYPKKILEVSNGYVLYENWFGDIDSESEQWFIVGMRLSNE